MNDLKEIIRKLGQKKILVVGDVMLDKYIWGNVSRISPEAPVQIVDVSKESYAPGGAANVATNIAGLGAGSCILGIVGSDTTRDRLVSELEKRRIDVSCLITDDSKRTIRKVRVFGRNQQLLRFDYEKKGYISGEVEKKAVELIRKKIGDFDAVVVSDYAKGLITENLMEELKNICGKEGKAIVVDPKPSNMGFYRSVDLIAPNHSEAQEMTGLDSLKNSDSDIENMGNKLIKELDSNVLITRGERGLSLFEKKGGVTHIPTFAKEVYDIVGAGDTVVASLGLAMSAGASLKDAAIIANHAAGITVGKVGTSTATVEELQESVEKQENRGK